MKSVIQDERECYICGRRDVLHEHHIFFGNPNRQHSEEHGMKVWLCPEHHNSSPKGVHFNRVLDRRLKMDAQAKFEETHTREEFREIFGRSYL